jgi:hypothetical protein
MTCHCPDLCVKHENPGRECQQCGEAWAVVDTTFCEACMPNCDCGFGDPEEMFTCSCSSDCKVIVCPSCHGNHQNYDEWEAGDHRYESERDHPELYEVM